MGGRVFEDAEGGPSFGEDSSTCSCLYGNPCGSSCMHHHPLLSMRACNNAHSAMHLPMQTTARTGRTDSRWRRRMGGRASKVVDGKLQAVQQSHSMCSQGTLAHSLDALSRKRLRFFLRAALDAAPQAVVRGGATIRTPSEGCISASQLHAAPAPALRRGKLSLRPRFVSVHVPKPDPPKSENQKNGVEFIDETLQWGDTYGTSGFTD